VSKCRRRDLAAAADQLLRAAPAVARSEFLSSLIARSALGFDSPPETRNYAGVLDRDPESLRRSLRLRQFGQPIIEISGGKKVHGAWGIPGGVIKPFTVADRDEMLGWVGEAYESAELALCRLKGCSIPGPKKSSALATSPRCSSAPSRRPAGWNITTVSSILSTRRATP
jgi:hypothetical protein